MREQLEQHCKASATLKANIGALESKVAEALNKKETLKARAASAQVSSHQLLTRLKLHAAKTPKQGCPPSKGRTHVQEQRCTGSGSA